MLECYFSMIWFLSVEVYEAAAAIAAIFRFPMNVM